MHEAKNVYDAGWYEKKKTRKNDFKL